MKPIKVSIIVPVLNEENILPNFLTLCLNVINNNNQVEFIFVDGGSKDKSVEIVRDKGFLCELSNKGRALQMNAGADKAKGQILFFLHADTINFSVFFPEELYRNFLEQNENFWGFCKIELNSCESLYKLIASGINFRANFFNVATGDQGIFVEKKLFDDVGGFANISLMEDIEISRRLKKISIPFVLSMILTTSCRRWKKKGVFITILSMWFFQLAYKCGLSPSILHRWYYGLEHSSEHGSEHSSEHNLEDDSKNG